jgi:Uma2 family endonuclease
MSAKIEPLMTVDDLEAMPEDGNRYEVIEGELFVSCAPGLTHQIISGNIHTILGMYLHDNPIGTVIATLGLILERYSGVIPDLVFFSNQRGVKIIDGERLVATPELVVEILSPGAQNIARDRVAKLQLYGKFGAQEYWIVDSANRAVEIYVLRDSTLSLQDKLIGAAVITSPSLPGFECSVARFFKNDFRL